jgi:hypothetical protein
MGITGCFVSIGATVLQKKTDCFIQAPMNRRQTLNSFLAESPALNRSRQTRDKHVVHRQLVVGMQSNGDALQSLITRKRVQVSSGYANRASPSRAHRFETQADVSRE